ncbi:MAG: superoxide dismutase family protein [Persicimonas sp.]
MLLGVWIGGCFNSQSTPNPSTESVQEKSVEEEAVDPEAEQDSGPTQTRREARTNLTSSYREPQGSVRLEETEDGVLVEASLENLDPGTYHLYVHDGGDCEPPNFNPADGPLAKIDHDWKSHAGDLGEIVVGSDGKGGSAHTDEVISLEDGEYDVFGEAVFLHEGAVDTQEKNARFPIACGVIWHPEESAPGALSSVPVAVDESAIKPGATPEQALEQMIPEGWSLFESATADLDADGDDDLIAFIENDKAKDGAPGDAYPQHRDVLIVLDDSPTPQLAVRSKRLLRERGEFGRSFPQVGLETKKGEFSISESGGGGSNRWTIEYAFEYQPEVSKWTLGRCSAKYINAGEKNSPRTKTTEYPVAEEFFLDNLNRRTFEGDCPKP